MDWWGRFVHRHRGVLLAVSAVVFALSVATYLSGATFRESNRFTFKSEQAYTLESQQLPHDQTPPTLGVIYTSDTLTASDTEFQRRVDAALEPARRDPRVSHVVTPWSLPPADRTSLVSRDGHAVAVSMTFGVDNSQARNATGNVIAEVTAPDLQLTTFGSLASTYDQDQYLASDLKIGALVSIPLALVLLIFIFGSVSAALVCLAIGVAGVTSGMAGTTLLSHVMDVTPYATDIVALVGLGVGIDYSLFIVSRYREELASGAQPVDALATTMSTAGRAIAYSGITVAAGLSGMIFFPGTFLVTMGLAGAIVVTTSVIFGLVLLPALLALLGPRINRWRVPFARGGRHGGLWRRIADFVMQRPVAVLTPTLLFILLLGSPFPSIRLANADINVLPAAAPSRIGTNQLAADFPGHGGSTIDVVLQFNSGSAYDPANVAAAYALSRRLAAIDGVSRVSSYVDLAPARSLSDYQALYAGGAPNLTDKTAAELLRTSTAGTITVLRTETGYAASTAAAESLVRDIRAHDATPAGRVYVDGETAFNIDIVDFITSRVPFAVISVMIATFVILLLLLRSIVLPLKAVVMNLLSLSAAFGALVWIFQQGHLSGVLNFTPEPLDPTIPVLLFCIVFGLSMDYEVFLMTRMQEAWETTHDNRTAVADGLEASGRLVTGAAAIMVCVFSTFAFGQVVIVKAIGMGMAIAVFCDATLVRALIVPALMRLLGGANWWAPAWLRRRR